MHLRLNQPAVISEIVDGEAIVVNLESGAYYSMRATAGVIWAALLHGKDAQAIATLLGEVYAVPVAAVAHEVDAFIDQLLAEQLVVPAANPPEAMPPLSIDLPPDETFTPPLLEKYTDMADLLLLDPIHEVDAETGWPQPAPKRH
ncbi:PqqD family protein [Candidatus Chloroploca sp. M-50]|uniref:PqqD family protein n=1 Tax=Candidatus Chloroploca mongolica TaxID=2528176 RepID=A0ABS4D490_9CHLR|nr:PqqD family protein [Candidatus Chloroploca mongolica]MBP1464255.1 PqqD family protein [Candidatus Chloroploca mongolica]